MDLRKIILLFLVIPLTVWADADCGFLENIPDESSQVLVVKALFGSQGQMTACQRQGQHWKAVLTPRIPVVLGENGLTNPEEKKEGDLKTPAGLYTLGEAFGTKPTALKLDYKYITAEDKYIDDIDSAQYNSWVTGETSAKSYENMLIAPYKMGIIVNYNKNPTIAGAGSAIFIHLWSSPTTPTRGCIATDKKHLSAILHWLDKKQHPYVFIS